MAEDAIVTEVLTDRRCNHHQSADHQRCNHHQSAAIIIKVLTTILKNGNRRAEYKQSITMYRVVPSCTFATIASAVKAQNTWPWHRHMWRGSYLSRLDFSKVSSASTHAHKSPEPRCYLPTTHTRANKGSHPGPNQNPILFFFPRALYYTVTTQLPHRYRMEEARQGRNGMKENTYRIIIIIIIAFALRIVPLLGFSHKVSLWLLCGDCVVTAK